MDVQKILLVDDEPINNEMLEFILTGDNREFLHATSGAEALDVANRELPDLVMLDVLMPEMDGYIVCERLKAEPATAQIPVIFVSALNQTDSEEKGLLAGAIDYVTKPFSPHIVRARVRNHLLLKTYRDKLESMAMMDGLTGIANRRQFDHRFEVECKRYLRSGTPLALLLMDIDFFKRYNDHYGHMEGDACLASVAQAMSTAARRPTDFLARYGGEEFVCLLPDTDLEGAGQVARQLLDAVRSLEIPHAESDAADHVTLSVGGVALEAIDGDQASLDPKVLLEAADANLYQAKEAGRNRVVLTPLTAK